MVRLQGEGLEADGSRLNTERGQLKITSAIYSGVSAETDLDVLGELPKSAKEDSLTDHT
jgi:hypothetical protein